jgi:hypothetical protein
MQRWMLQRKHLKVGWVFDYFVTLLIIKGLEDVQ